MTMDPHSLGHVRLTIQAYNQLLLENSLFKRSLGLRKSYNGENLIVTFNPQVVEMLIQEAYTKSSYTEEFMLTDVGSWNSMDVYVGDKKPEVTTDAVDEP